MAESEESWRDILAPSAAHKRPTFFVPPTAFEEVVVRKEDEARARKPPLSPPSSSPPSTSRSGSSDNSSSRSSSWSGSSGSTSGMSPKAKLKAQAKDEPRRLKVKVVSCTGLRDADTVGKSDPYCTIEITTSDGRSKFEGRTKVSQDSLSPVWNHVWSCLCTRGDVLRFAVLDEDKGTFDKTDDFLGGANLRVEEILRSGGYAGMLQLTGDGKSKPRLKLHVTVEDAMRAARPSELQRDAEAEARREAKAPMTEREVRAQAIRRQLQEAEMRKMEAEERALLEMQVVQEKRIRAVKKIQAMVRAKWLRDQANARHAGKRHSIQKRAFFKQGVAQVKQIGRAHV